MTKKLLSIILSFILLITMSAGNLTAFAEDQGHKHTEECYSKEGDLLCDPTSDIGHIHEESCYCQGGEYICGFSDLEEEHTHTESCVCTGGELICTDAAVALISYSTDDPISTDTTVAMIGETSYDSLSDAIQAIINSSEKSGTIVITNDQTVSSYITIPKDVSITITDDGNSHVITKESNRIFTIQEGGILTIDGNLTFKPAEKSNACMIECHGTFTLNNGTFDGNNLNINKMGNTHDYTGMIFVCGKNAKFTMNGGKLLNAKLTNLTGAVRICCNAEFIMNNGTISGFDSIGRAQSGTVLVLGSTNYSNGSASFTMKGGSIENNKGYRGVGVHIVGYHYSSKASMTMEGGSIKNNTAYSINEGLLGCGAGVFIELNANFTMNNGEISGNTVYGGQGGGISAACGWEGSNSDINYWSQYYPASFTMNGGKISGNKATMKVSDSDDNIQISDAGCGGGIYLASNCINLNCGQIENNTSERQGGGVYVSSVPYVITLKKAIIKNNSASILGGGIWACPTGNVELFVTEGSALYDNTSKGAGDDFVSVKDAEHNYKYSVTLSERSLGGGKEIWYEDGGVDSSSKLGLPDKSIPRYDASENANPLINITQNTNSLALKSVISDNAKKLSENEGKLFITGNSSERGGGIGTNGGMVLGIDNSDYTLYVEKDWKDLKNDSLKTPVTVFLKIGDTVLDSVELNKENNYSSVFKNLPNPESLSEGLTYSVCENPVPDNFVPDYKPAVIDKDNRTIKISVENKYFPTGNLTVSKTVSGNKGDTTKEFTFNITLNDTSINGTYGDMEFKNGTAVFKLKHNESITASKLPEDIEYTVTEYDNTGYTVTVNNTSDTKATGTIAANETAVAAFNNHKSGGNGNGYKPNISKPVSVTLNAEKTLNGNIPPTDSFTFVLKDEKGNIVQTAKNNNGSITFDDIFFYSAGTYVYTISEAKGTDNSIKYDETVYNVIIKVTKSDDYTAAVTYEKDGQIYNSIPTFANTTVTTAPDKPDNPDNPTLSNGSTSISDNNSESDSLKESVDRVPCTGDDSNVGLWISLLIISVIGMIGFYITRRMHRS